MKKRNRLSIIHCLLLLGIMFFFMSNAASAAPQANKSSIAKEDFMNTAYKTKSPAIPPIDAAAPTSFQTASFGLG